MQLPAVPVSATKSPCFSGPGVKAMFVEFTAAPVNDPLLRAWTSLRPARCCGRRPRLGRPWRILSTTIGVPGPASSSTDVLDAKAFQARARGPFRATYAGLSYGNPSDCNAPVMAESAAALRRICPPPSNMLPSTFTVQVFPDMWQPRHPFLFRSAMTGYRHTPVRNTLCSAIARTHNPT
jgi:hypothetical protein